MSIIKMVMVFHSMKTVIPFPVSQLEKLIEKANLSLEAQEYLQLTVFSALGMPELLGEKQ